MIQKGSKRSKIVRRILKSLLWLTAGIIILLISIILLIRLPVVQNFITHKAVNYLSGKIHTKVSLRRIEIAFPKKIHITNLYLEDKAGDTLISLNSLYLDISLFDLLSNKLTINLVDISGVKANIKRLYPDTTFNYSFIIDAFSPTDTIQKPADTTAGMEFSLGRINLQNIDLVYADTIGGIRAEVKLGSFNTKIDEFNLGNMKFRIGSVKLSDSRFSIIQTSPLDTTNSIDTSSLNFSIASDNVDLTNLKVKYVNKSDSINAHLNLGKLSVKDGKYFGDTVSVNKFIIENTFIAFDNNKGKPIKNGIDFNHLLITGLSLELAKTEASPRHATLSLEHFSFRDKCGFLLKDFTTQLTFDSTHIDLAELDIQTGHSRIRSRLSASYPSIDSLSKSPERIVGGVILDRATISMQDVLFFVPQLSKDTNFRNYQLSTIDISGKIDGSMKNLEINDLDIKTGAVTNIRLEGSAENISNPEKMYADIRLKEFITSASDIHALLPPGLIPENIDIPSFIETSGFFKGYMKNFDGRLTMNTSSGDLDAKVTMRPEKDFVADHYNVDLAIEALNVGKITKQPDIGLLSLELEVDGSGFDTATVSASVDLIVQSAVYKGYNYKDFKLKGNLSKMSFDGEASISDENVKFSYAGYTNFDPRNIKAELQLYLAGVDLKALNLSEQDLRISGNVAADIRMADNGNVLGKASLAHIIVIVEEKKLAIDSVIFSSTEVDGVSDISIKSPVISAGLHGTIIMQELVPSLTSHINSYFDFQGKPDTLQLHPQSFEFNVTMIDPSMAESFVPTIKKVTPFEIKGNYDSEAKIFNAEGTISQIIYSGITIDTLKFLLNSDLGKFDYSFTAAAFYNEMLRMEKFDLNGEMANDNIIFNLKSEKEDSGVMISVAGNIKKDAGGMRMTIDPEVVLAGTNWKVADGNYLQFGKGGMVARNIVFSNNGESFTINSKGTTGDSPLDINFQNFELGNLSSIIEKDKKLVRGSLNGAFTLTPGGFTSDLKIASFTFQEVPVGDIELNASNKQLGVYDLSLKVSGDENDLILSGVYQAGDKEDIDLVLDIRNLSMSTIEPFTFGQVTRMTGTADGNIRISGTFKQPGINGVINIKKFAFNPVATGTYLAMEDNAIRFDGTRILLDNLTLSDTLSNKAVVNGFADIRDFNEILFDIKLKTTDFLAMNTIRKKDAVIYGKILLDSDIHLTGTLKRPIINMKVGLNEGTNITFVNPSREAGLVEYEGILVFVDSLSLQNEIMTKPDTTVKSSVTELDLKAVIEINEEAQLKMMIDPVAGDSLYVKGGGVMEFTLDPSGTMSLTGRYKINDGGYHLTVSGVLKRDFKIRKGSTVTWNGEIMEAEADITAIYNVKTSPLLLVEDQLAGADEQQKNKYRNELQFEVLLMMKGILRKPDIRFDIELADKDRGAMGGVVYAKLAELREDENQLNKQVFALLSLNRFIGEDPLESGNAPLTVSSAARSSASKVLTNQLNNLSERYVKGVDLDVGVKSYEDYSTGEAEGRTELELGISKELMQGRVVVEVGGSIDVEGEKSTQNNLSDIAGNISIQYRITEDGRLGAKVFRVNEFENPIEGELIKTGVGLIYTKDFNRIRDLYNRENNDKRKK